jgi:hypothetical protein
LIRSPRFEQCIGGWSVVFAGSRKRAPFLRNLQLLWNLWGLAAQPGAPKEAYTVRSIKQSNEIEKRHHFKMLNQVAGTPAAAVIIRCQERCGRINRSRVP